MVEVNPIIFGVLVLIVAVPIGNFLARLTSDELASRQRLFKFIILICFIGAIVTLVFREDALLFTFLFISIVTSQSLRKKVEGDKLAKVEKKEVVLAKKSVEKVKSLTKESKIVKKPRKNSRKKVKHKKKSSKKVVRKKRR